MPTFVGCCVLQARVGMHRLTVMVTPVRSGARGATLAAKVVGRVRRPVAMTEVLWGLLVGSGRAAVMTVAQARQVIVSVAERSLIQ